MVGGDTILTGCVIVTVVRTMSRGNVGVYKVECFVMFALKGNQDTWFVVSEKQGTLRIVVLFTNIDTELSNEQTESRYVDYHETRLPLTFEHT
jgi:hypothetical protein